MTAILPVPGSYEQCREAVFAPVFGASPLARIAAALAPFAEVVIAVAGPLVEEVRRTVATQHFPPVRVVHVDPPGGRAQCIDAGLRAAGPAGGSVLLHDLGWPLITAATIDSVVCALRHGAAAVLPIRPVTDSVKAVDGRGAVTATLDRAPLRTVQYPRGFDTAVLHALLPGGADGAFDELEALLSTTTAPTLVEGDTGALRFDLPADAALLAALIASRQDHPD
ncbi:4-diphosphocytidyl-2C-methyl-D-erythritol synthase [Mycobacterium sp. smrl_JER01]